MHGEGERRIPPSRSLRAGWRGGRSCKVQFRVPLDIRITLHRRCEACSSQHCTRFHMDVTSTGSTAQLQPLGASATTDAALPHMTTLLQCAQPYIRDVFVVGVEVKEHGMAATSPMPPSCLSSGRISKTRPTSGTGTPSTASHPGIGLLRLPPDAPHADDEPPVDNSFLSENPVLQALHFLYDVLEGPGGRTDPPADMESPSAFERASNAKIAPNFTCKREKATSGTEGQVAPSGPAETVNPEDGATKTSADREQPVAMNTSHGNTDA